MLSLGVLHHTSDAERGFRELRRLVRPGGYFIVGLYNTLGRLHISAVRRTLQIVSRNDQERALDLAQRYCMPILRRSLGDGADERARVADMFAHPHERPVALHTTVGWFERAGLTVVGGTPSYRFEDYFPRLSRAMPVGRSSWLAHRLIELRWVRWQVDYNVIAGPA